ncbi:MAG: glycosyltransferase family 4 protein [Chloroflexi bacterium]|nr:glycosyltransferase family 4 protein [Chloroflexota bacterium]
MHTFVVSQYFRPEVGATQNRLATFADGLVARGHRVTVVCEQPNHPAGVFAAGYGRRPLMTERAGPLTVRRTWVAASPRKTTVRRLAFYGTFGVGAAALIATARRADVMLASSPPLPGALAAAAAAAARRLPFVLDVRDLWPAAAEALGELSNPRVLGCFERAERWLYQHAARVTATTMPFCRHIDAVAGRPVSVHLPNGALDELVALPAAPPPRGPFTVGYAGNFGIAQGLGIVLDAADELRDEDVRFVLAGAGPLQSKLRAERDRRGLSAVDIRPAVPVADVGALLLSCHALLIPLRDHPLLQDFIPSKLYDAMAVGRPALVAAPGEAAALVREHACGVELAPEDGAGLARAVRALIADPAAACRMGCAGKAAAGRYARSRQVDRLDDVLRAAAAGRRG